jgi:aspartyl-tRNA(Asn)/glutamyl-tRNA(Gln) amidotransferase subunit B
METRGWDDGRQATYRMRAKETSDDYRYFPEPDLPPLRVDAAWIDGIRDRLPELPAARRARYASLGLGAYDAAVIVADPSMTTSFDAICAAGAAPAREVANFVTGAHARELKSTGPNRFGLAGSGKPADVAALLIAIADGRVSRSIGRDLLADHLSSGEDATALLANAGPGPINDDASLVGYIDAVIAANPRAVADYRAGKPVAGFLVGQVMKATAGAADAARVTALVRSRLESLEPEG